MSSNARDRAETRDHYRIHALAGKGAVRDLLSCLDELDEQAERIAELETARVDAALRIAELEAWNKRQATTIEHHEFVHDTNGKAYAARIAELETELQVTNDRLATLVVTKNQRIAELEAQVNSLLAHRELVEGLPPGTLPREPRIDASLNPGCDG